MKNMPKPYFLKNLALYLILIKSEKTKITVVKQKILNQSHLIKDSP